MLTYFSDFPPTHIASLVIQGGCGILPYREPPFSLRQQPCHALGSALPMAGTGPTPGADSRSLTVPRSPSTKTAPSVKQARGCKAKYCLHSHLVKNYFCILPLPSLFLSLPPLSCLWPFGRHHHLHIQPLHHEPGRDAISHQPKNTDIAQPSPETDKEKEWGQACPGQIAE